MNKLKTFKYKTSSPPENSLLSKISKRYSTVVNSKLLRKSSHSSAGHHSNSSNVNNNNSRRSCSPQKHIISGSYNMSGYLSEDHKTEIGAPILISKTNLDIDRIENDIILPAASPAAVVRVASANTNSSGSENEVFADAIGSFQNIPDIKFEFKPRDLHVKENSLTESCQPVQITNTNTIKATNTMTNSKLGSSSDSDGSAANGENSLYETPKSRNLNDADIVRQKNRSKSAQNLHKSELRVFLQRAPSNLEMDFQFTTADLDNCFDLPSRNHHESDNDDDELPLPPLPTTKPPNINLKHEEKEENLISKMTTVTATPIAVNKPKILSYSEPNTPMNPEKTDYINHCKSAESLNRIASVSPELRKSNNGVFSSSVTEMNRHYSRDSVVYTSSIEDFDLKSVSFQSLDAKNLFMSIEELNDITREINESEDFNHEIDLEYCEHRDKLKPNERRITLLKNKNSRLLNLDKNKEKLNHAWSGLKHWIGEESGKFKEVVQKHAAMQRVGGIKTDAEYKNSMKSGTLTANRNPTRESVEKSEMTSSLSQRSSIHSEEQSISGQTLVAAGGNNNNSAGGGVIMAGIRGRNSCESDAPSINNRIDEFGSMYTIGGNTDISSFSKPNKLKEGLEGQNGFEELRRYIKQGGDFGKDLVIILQERIESEQLYAKSLTKMATKLSKACRDVPGSIAEAWRGVATEMESRSEIHRQMSASLLDEIVKPLKSLLENHHKTRKTVETNVDKAARILTEWRISESKAKKLSHTAARENEKLQDAMLDVRIQKSPSIAMLQQQNGPNKNLAEKEIKNAEKDCAKLDNKRRKAEEAVKRADVEYYTLCIRSERARVDWEMSVLRGSLILQSLENQRLTNMKTFVSNYARLTSDINPILEEINQRLAPQIESCNVQKDLSVVKSIQRTAEGPSEQLLPDFYCEHTTLAMNRERRKHALVKLLQLVKTDLERERRSRNGLKGLSQTMSNQDNQNITDKLYHIRSMLTYLEGSRFKLQSALLELDHKPRTSHPLAPHIQITRDRTGLQQSILKVPLWLKNNDKMSGNNHNIENNLINGKENDFDCVDIKNEILIKHFDKNFNRSKSTTELILNGQTQQHQNEEIYENNMINNVGNHNNHKIHNEHDADSLNFDRGIADGGSNQPDSDFDEFSSQDEDDEDSIRRKSSHDKLDGIIIPVGNYMNNDKLQITTTNHGKNSICSSENSSSSNNGNEESESACNNNNSNIIVISKCKALYSYTPKLYDELELTPGDIIEVHVKQEDGWWLGALGERIGIFPATYVEEF